MAFNRIDAATHRRIILAQDVETDLDGSLLEELMSGMSRLIAKSTERVARAGASGNDDFLDGVVAEERDVIDSLIGCAFVLCQTYITAVACRVVHAAKRLEIDSAASRNQVTRLGVSESEELGSTIIEAIDAAANYFKHHDEWITTREDHGETRREIWVENGANKHTIKLAKAWGLQPNGSGNLQKVLKALGIQGNTRLCDLVTPIKAWQTALVEIVRAGKNRPTNTPIT